VKRQSKVSLVIGNTLILELLNNSRNQSIIVVPKPPPHELQLKKDEWDNTPCPPILLSHYLLIVEMEKPLCDNYTSNHTLFILHDSSSLGSRDCYRDPNILDNLSPIVSLPSSFRLRLSSACFSYNVPKCPATCSPACISALIALSSSSLFQRLLNFRTEDGWLQLILVCKWYICLNDSRQFG
jgi:hypothetical protein